MKEQNRKRSISNGKLLIIVSAVAVVAALSYLVLLSPYGAWLRDSAATNYAEEVAKPIEKELIDAGATKEKSSGDNGRGISNSIPAYSSQFKVPLGEAETAQLVKDTAARNGFDLTQATLEDKGPVNVIDQYVDNWYYDNTSRDADFPGLSEGKIDFMAEVNVEDSDTDPNFTTVRFNVRLPAFTR